MVGLDGIVPGFAEKFMADGAMPNLLKMAVDKYKVTPYNYEANGMRYDQFVSSSHMHSRFFCFRPPIV